MPETTQINAQFDAERSRHDDFAMRVLDKIDGVALSVAALQAIQSDCNRRIQKIETEIESRVRILEQWRFYVVGFVAAVGAALAFTLKK